MLLIMRPNPFFDPAKPPQLITANFIDLDRVYMISKYRSGAGHDYSLNGETCRSMKHYFNTSHHEDPVTHIPQRSYPAAGETNIKLYAPFDGLITAIGSEKTPIGQQVQVMALHNPWFTARLFHIDLLPGLHVGSWVKSGQQIATIGPRDGTDFALETNQTGIGGSGVSMFEAMTDEAFAPYAKLGYQRSDFIISRAERDAHPLKCLGGEQERFEMPQDYDPTQDHVFLRPDPYGDMNHGPGARTIRYGPPPR